MCVTSRNIKKYCLKKLSYIMLSIFYLLKDGITEFSAL